MFLWDTVEFTHMALRLVPKILNPVDMILLVCKELGMVDPEMLKVRHIKWVGPALLDSLAAKLRCIPIVDHAAKILFITSCCCCGAYGYDGSFHKLQPECGHQTMSGGVRRCKSWASHR
jgi:hypothetical protein